jgi:hypothetical protein
MGTFKNIRQSFAVVIGVFSSLVTSERSRGMATQPRPQIAHLLIQQLDNPSFYHIHAKDVSLINLLPDQLSLPDGELLPQFIDIIVLLDHRPTRFCHFKELDLQNVLRIDDLVCFLDVLDLAVAVAQLPAQVHQLDVELIYHAFLVGLAVLQQLVVDKGLSQMWLYVR